MTALLLVCELVTRVVRAPLWFGSFREFRLDLVRRNYPAMLDDTLGYAPQPGFASHDNHWGTQVTIDGDGLRSNGDQPRPDGPLIVCVGDSFTFGDEVDDDQTWPAALERLLDRPVRNGGVFGYSFTQTVLRGEQLLDRLQPQVLIVSLIADDLLRSCYSRRYTNLPILDLDGDGLVLKGVPIDHAALPPDPARWWKDLLGHSALVDAVLANTCKQWWYEDQKQVVLPHLFRQLCPLGMRIVDRIDAACRARGTRLLLVLQGGWRPDWIEPVLQHAVQQGVQTLDLAARVAELAERDPALPGRYFRGHMTPAGNAWVADEIAAALRE
ncbi:MAG: hypothetical protein H6835_09805 [Planctomycetes bacterium]|nr:hypothetical protein [Planctomycetota bacterium]